jgi:hypothetical protein
MQQKAVTTESGSEAGKTEKQKERRTEREGIFYCEIIFA